MSAEQILDEVLEETKRQWMAATEHTLTPGPDGKYLSPAEAAEAEAASAEEFAWIDLAPVLSGQFTQPVPEMLFRNGDGIRSGLIYRNMVNGFFAASGVGKGWLTLLLAVERVQAGETIALIDLEDIEQSVMSRLRILGLTDEQIIAQVRYARPTDALGPVKVAQLCNSIVADNISLVIIDSLGEALGNEGKNEDSDVDVGYWYRHVARPIAEVGPAVVIVDHSTKSRDRSLHPSGSKRKRAATGGAMYLVEVVTGFKKGGSGRLRLICAKDRNGTYSAGEHVAWLDMNHQPDGTMTLELVAPPPRVEGDTADELIGRKVFAVLNAQPDGMSKAALNAEVRRGGLKASNAAIGDAVALLIHNGDVISTPGPRGAIVLSLPTGGSS